MKKSLLVGSLLGLISVTTQAEDLSKYQDESRAVAMPFLKQLAAANQKAVADSGHDSAIGVCKDIAPKMAGDISRQTGWKLTRVSLKVRNPLLGTPDAWEQKQLISFAERAAKGEKPEILEASEIVQEPAGASYRFMKAIPLQQGCVACHGDNEQITDNVRSRLNTDYPHDKATGYSVGQIRGAVSIKRSL